MNSYKIETFQDFLKVPPDKIEKCLSQFSEAVIMASHANALALALGDPKGLEMRGMVWNDDEEDKLTITLQVQHDKATQPNP